MSRHELINTASVLAKRSTLRARRNLHERFLTSQPLPAAIDAERHAIATSNAGAISYYRDVSARGRPLLLLHGVHAAASAYEMRNLFEEFRGERPVYAVDLPGFGFSQRGGMAYDANVYVHAIADVLRHIALDCPGERVDIVALSLSSEYAARVAVELPDMLQSLTLLSPTGFDAQRQAHASARKAPRAEARRLWGALAELGGELLFDVLVSRPSLGFYLRRSFAGHVDYDMLDYAYATSHQPGAHYAPLAFIRGELFPKGDPTRTYGEVKLPTLILYGDDPFTGFGALRGFLLRHTNYDAVRMPNTHGLPQIEACDRTVRALRAFWDRIAAEEITEVTRRDQLGMRSTHYTH